MTRIIVDDSLRSRLNNLVEPLELCDTSGRLLARLTPAEDSSEYTLCEPLITEDELREREQSSEWLTTAEVLTHLKNLEFTDFGGPSNE
jgi:hypothetical protein